MKVGIITFHRAINYGAVLQAYALKKKIDELGNVTKVINYINLKEKEAGKVIKTNSLKSFVGSLLKLKFFRQKNKKFIMFRNKYLNLTPEIKNKDMLKKMDREFDVFFTGSDQVWNYNITDGDMAYLLDFASNNKKNSYAASFGVTDIDEKYKKIYKRLLEDFSNISVREEIGKTIVNKLCNKNAYTVLDPTLLLDSIEWKKIAKSSKENKYILIYLLTYSERIYKLAERLSNDFGLKIIVIAVDIKTFKFSRKYKYYLSAGPEEFLGLFMNAEYIITNSFHGTVFSLIFNKKLIVDYLNDKGKNIRLENILQLFKLEDRVLREDNYLSLCKDIDYEMVNKALSIEREKSIKYLKNVFNIKD